MDIWRFNTLMIFIRFSTTSWFPLGKLRVDSSLVICLRQLNTLDRIVRCHFSFRESLIGLPCWIEDDLFGCDIICSRRFHWMHTRCCFRTNLSSLNQLLLLLCCLNRLLSLELTASAFKVLAYVQWWCPKAVSVLTLSSWLLSRASRWLNKLINRLVNQSHRNRGNYLKSEHQWNCCEASYLRIQISEHLPSCSEAKDC